MADNIWSSAGSTDGNLAGNWSLGVAPQSGDRLVFDATSVVNCTFTANFSCDGINAAAAYTGTIDFDTFDVTGDNGADFIFDNVWVDLGSGTIATTNGTLDYKDITTLASSGVVLDFSGTCTYTPKNNTSHNISIDVLTGTTTTVSAGPRIGTGAVTVRNGATLDWGSQRLNPSVVDVLVEATGTMTGGVGWSLYMYGGSLNLLGSSSGMAVIYLVPVTSTITIHPGIIACPIVITAHTNPTRFAAGDFVFADTVRFWSYLGSDGTVDCATNAVTSITCQDDVTFDIDGVGDIIIDNSGQAVAWNFQADIIDAVVGAGSVVWTSGIADPEITFSGTADQDIDLVGASVKDVEEDKSAGTVALTGALTCNSFTNTDGDLDLNGQTLTTTNNATFSSGSNFDLAADSMNGCSIIVGGDCSFDGQTMNATGAWTLTVTGLATATNVVVAYSDASGGTQIDASDETSTDNGNNINWLFISSKIINLDWVIGLQSPSGHIIPISFDGTKITPSRSWILEARAKDWILVARAP